MADYIVSLKADVSKVKKDIESIGDSIGKLTAAAQVFAAFWVSSEFVKAGIEFEDQLNQVAVAFKQTGITSSSATKNIADFAAEIQKTTRFSDNAVLTTASLIQTLARLDSQGLKRATQAALDLSTSLRIDLNTAATMIGKAAEGNVTAFGKMGIAIEKGKTNADTLANTLAVLEARFGGASISATNTFGGALDQLKNNFDDVIKNIGLAIIQNDDLIKVVKILSDAMAGLAEIIADNADTIKEFISTGISVLSEIIKRLPSAIEAVTAALIAFTTVGLAQSAIAVVTLASQIGVLAVAQRAYNIVLLATKGLMSSLGIGLVVAAVSALAYWVIELYKDFGSLNGVIQGAGIQFKKFYATITGNTEAVADYEKQLVDLKAAADQAKDAAKGSFDEQKAYRQMAKEERQRQTEEIQAAESQRAKILAENLIKEREAAQKNIDGIKSTYKNAGLDAFDLLTRDTTQAISDVSKALNLGVITQKEAVALRANIDAEYYKKSTALAEEQSKKEIEARKKTFDQIGSIFADVAKGASGAASLVSKGVGAIADTLLPGIGGFVGQVTEFLAQGPDKVKETIASFAAAIPSVISNIILAIPALIQAIIDAQPMIIDALIASLPQVIQGFVEQLPQLISSLITLMPRVSYAFTIGLIKLIPTFFNAFIAGLPDVFVEFSNQLIKAAGDFINSIWEWIKNTIPGAGAAGKAATGDFGGAASDVLSGIGDFFGFANGGMVPAGYPNDSYPAKLSSGEAILPTDTVQKLESFLANGGGGAGQNVTINLVVGEEQLAKVMLNLNRQGFRTS